MNCQRRRRGATLSRGRRIGPDKRRRHCRGHDKSSSGRPAGRFGAHQTLLFAASAPVAGRGWQTRDTKGVSGFTRRLMRARDRGPARVRLCHRLIRRVFRHRAGFEPRRPAGIRPPEPGSEPALISARVCRVAPVARSLRGRSEGGVYIKRAARPPGRMGTRSSAAAAIQMSSQAGRPSLLD